MSFILFCLCPASTRKLYEKKLQKLLDQPPAEPEAPTDVTTLPKADSNQNGNTNSDQYSDKEDGEIWTHITNEVSQDSPRQITWIYHYILKHVFFSPHKTIQTVW